MVDGAFNVNSTSCESVEGPALQPDRAIDLSGCGTRLPVSPTAGTTSGSVVTLNSGNLLNPIPRFLSTVPGASQSGSQAVNLPWSGMRSLSDAQVTDLANADRSAGQGPRPLPGHGGLPQPPSGWHGETRTRWGPSKMPSRATLTNSNQKIRAFGVINQATRTAINGAIANRMTWCC